MATLLVFASALTAGIATNCAAASPGPLSPAEALRSFELEPGLKVELMAAEPQTIAPCALAWDEGGYLYVAENRGYPTGGPGGSAAGIVARFEDTDGDGLPDKRTEFATGFTYPNGVMPWRGGLIVTCAPEVWYCKDTDGDGRSDVREVLLTGFATNASTQLRVNRPLLALDGWVYLASGLSGGRITSPKRPAQAPLELRGDLRFKPDTGEYEHTDGKSQFGQSFDDFGRRFGVFNRVQVQHFVLPSRYVERNPHLASPGLLHNCPDLIDNPFMRGGGAAARIYPISANVTTADSHAGTFSAACAIHVYGGGALPEGYLGEVFTCDPTGNLVHRDRLIPAGPTFAARRVGENVEVLRSRDDWFRPVFLETGPDGALYVCDMYRKVIEHPEYLPVEVRKRTDFDAGKDRGRIWRVTARQAPGVRRLDMGSMSDQRLVAELANANLWRRQTAFRLLLERKEPKITGRLKSGLARIPHPGSVAMRLHLLAARQTLSEEELLIGLSSRSAGVREVALRLSEPFLAPSPPARLSAEILRSAEDPDARVRFQSALALGWLCGRNEQPVLQALARIGARDGADKWSRAAVLSSVTGQERVFLHLLLGLAPQHGNDRTPLLTDVGRVLAGATPEADRLRLVEEILSEGHATRAAASGSGADPESLSAVLAGFSETRLAVLRDTLAGPRGETLRDLLAAARKLVVDATVAMPRRLRAVQLLATEGAAANAILLSGVHAGEDMTLLSALVRVLTLPPNDAGARELLSRTRWSGYTPGLRGAVLAALLSRPEHYALVLDAVEAGTVSAGALTAGQKEQVQRAKADGIKQRAQKLFGLAGGGDRMRAFELAKACLALPPRPGQGRAVFKRLCAPCHRLDQEGVAVGPDLFDIRNQSKESILLHIVVPEQEIAPNFANYQCETKDGRQLSGLIVAETATALTLRQAQGLEETVLRSDLASLSASSLSLMPQEMEKGMTSQEMADLLAYLRGEGE